MIGGGIWSGGTYVDRLIVTMLSIPYEVSCSIHSTCDHSEENHVLFQVRGMQWKG